MTRPCVKCGRNRAERFFVSPKGRTCVTCRSLRTRSTTRAVRIFQTYGLTPEEHDALLAMQCLRCAICQRTPRYNMDVDHDHKTGQIRGLLCKLCNRRLLPSVRDEIATLYRAVEYLRHPPALRALDRIVIVPGSQP